MNILFLCKTIQNIFYSGQYFVIYVWVTFKMPIEICVGLHVNCQLFLSNFNKNLENSDSLVTAWNIRVHYNLFSESLVIQDS